MKILGISGSPTKDGNNEKAINIVLDIAKNNGFDVEQIFHSAIDINPCNACGICAKGNDCPIDDDVKETLPKLIEADAIIVSSPVYFGSVSAQIKSLFDRSVILRRRGFALKNKIGAALSVGGSRNGGQEKTIQIIHDWMHIQSMIIVGDGNHFGGILHKPIESDEIGIKTVEDTIENVCEVLNKFFK
ncbi:MAG: flavodoxin family protein [Methanosarcinaceae archaeon]|jgi:multimeric flavodoxin WrbA|nr:flavodoxin family protein [Methanosarcinaceae archaeon]NKQ38051.1 flavodoxin family protein [Methanosarcinales archaeon]